MMKDDGFKLGRSPWGEQGFTLVELILSIAVLAIITMPIMNYFTDSMEHNMRSRMKQDATLVAQNILEDFKNSSYSLDDVNVVCSAVPDWTVSSAQSAVGEKYTLTKDITLDERTFQVEAEIDPLSSSAPVSYKEYLIGSMDTSTDVMSSEGGNTLTKAQLSFFNKYQATCKANNTTMNSQADTYEEFEDLLNLEIVVSGEQDPNNDRNKIFRTTYVYTYNSSLGSLDGIDSYKYKEEISAYSIVKDKVENIYLFYTPLNANDLITLKLRKNKNGVEETTSDYGASDGVNDVKLFVIAQNSLDDAGNEVNNIVPGYQVAIKVETGSECFSNAISKVYTNLENSNVNTTAFSGLMEYSLVHSEDVNRLADIKVKIIKDAKEYVLVSGSKVQQ